MFENKFSLVNKKILVTGASSGIGRATAILLSNLGADMVINGRNEEKLNETWMQLNQEGNHIKMPGDLTEENVLNELVAAVGPLDGIVLSAGKVKTLPFKFLNKKDLQDIMSVNFESPVLLCQKLLKNKKVAKGGSIIFVSSIAGNLVADKGNSAYAASKAALNGICKVMALELASQKIRVNCVCPGMVRTALIQTELTAISEDQLKINEAAYPLGYGDPDDIAYSIAYLASDASKWVTGSSLTIDGGITIS